MIRIRIQRIRIQRIRIRYLISSQEECSDVIGYYISPIGSRYLCPIMPCTPRIPF